jgi:hypothetical protein
LLSTSPRTLSTSLCSAFQTKRVSVSRSDLSLAHRIFFMGMPGTSKTENAMAIADYF